MMRKCVATTALLVAAALAGCDGHGGSADQSPASAVSRALAPPVSAASLCTEVGGAWSAAGEKCTAEISNASHNHMQLSASYPASLLDDSVIGPVVAGVVKEFFAQFGGRYDDRYQGNSDATMTYTAYQHAATATVPRTQSLVFATNYYIARAAHPSNSAATFTFDLRGRRQIQLADLMCSHIDPLVALPPLVRPYVQAMLDEFNKRNHADLPITDFEPPPSGRKFSYASDYRAWYLDGDDLVLVMPAERDGPVGTGLGTTRVPLTAVDSLFATGGCLS